MLQDLIQQSQYIISISGSGLSVASGLPTYRTANGIWQGNDPAMLTEISLQGNPTAFWEFFRLHWLSIGDAQPNAAHLALARANMKAHITQNVDGLLQKAGANHVLEMHGNLQTAHCCRCLKRVDLPTLTDPVPACICGGLFRPEVVMYGDPLDGDDCDTAEDHIANADLIFVIGTSLQVNPLADMVIQRPINARVVVIDPHPPELGCLNVTYLRTPAEEILPSLF